MKPYITNKYEEKNNLLYEKAFAEWRNILIEFESVASYKVGDRILVTGSLELSEVS